MSSAASSTNISAPPDTPPAFAHTRPRRPRPPVPCRQCHRTTSAPDSQPRGWPTSRCHDRTERPSRSDRRAPTPHRRSADSHAFGQRRNGPARGEARRSGCTLQRPDPRTGVDSVLHVDRGMPARPMPIRPPVKSVERSRPATGLGIATELINLGFGSPRER
jgi:hypothetical protein